MSIKMIHIHIQRSKICRHQKWKSKNSIGEFSLIVRVRSDATKYLLFISWCDQKRKKNQRSTSQWATTVKNHTSFCQFQIVTWFCMLGLHFAAWIIIRCPISLFPKTTMTHYTVTKWRQLQHTDDAWKIVSIYIWMKAK